MLQEVTSEFQTLFTSLKAFTAEEVAKHNQPSNAWVIIDGLVYDVSKFAALHPGGTEVLLKYAGKDATKDFKVMHHPAVLQKAQYKKLCIGRLDWSEKDLKTLVKKTLAERTIPFSDPYWYDTTSTLKSPFYNDKHRAFQRKVRDFVNREIRPFAGQWDEQGDLPKGLEEKAYAAGVYGAPWPKEYGGTPPDGWDTFMDFILLDEIARSGAGGLLATWFLANNIALPPIINHGSPMLKEKIAKEVIQGRMTVGLAVTEPWGGSDVARVRCTAVRDGNFYIVNGEKKFITAGMRASYFTTAVRTGKGMGGLSVLIIDAKLPGVTVKRQKTQGWWSSSTCYITFENVRVPAEYLIGKENNGFKYIMENFNHERFAGVVFSLRGCRTCIEEAVRYARVRETFGKRLIDNQVIQHKIVNMSMQTEAIHAFVEQIAYQMENGGSHTELAPRLAMAKVMTTKHMELCAREASQIFGGNSYVRGGQGEKIERFYREVRVAAIGGGSEEIMTDFVGRASKL